MQLGVRDVVAVVRDFSARLVDNTAALNALNVFPVADNDTGTNMVRTLQSITAALDGVTDLEAAASDVAVAALDGRGNSGLIIGQFLAGFFSSFDGASIDLSHGLNEGARCARRSVARPVEGTMLTVADVAASAFQSDPGQPLDTLVAVVVKAVEATPGQLAVLAERGVVDSGAAGLLLFFEALGATMSGDLSRPSSGFLSNLIVCDVGLRSAGESTTLANEYEIQFRVPVSLISDAELRPLLMEIGTDVVVGSSVEELAAHLHVTDPHLATAAISQALEHRPGAKAISYDVEPILESGAPS